MTKHHMAIIIASLLTASTLLVLLFSPAAGAGYDTDEYSEIPFRHLPPRFHFLDKLTTAGPGYLWLLESNEDSTYTLDFLPSRNLTKREMQVVHEQACIMAQKFPGFKLKGTAFYLPNGILYGSPCVRPDVKGVPPDPYKR